MARNNEMETIRVGVFEIDVAAPWPCWITVRCGGQQLGAFDAKHLPDLKFAIARAQQAAELKLGPGSEAADP